ncbi:MAG: hypothetical protein OXH76_13185 [Boseongicola sp.]|nr:hypothetical protein [Boseongicola sp.]
MAGRAKHHDWSAHPAAFAQRALVMGFQGRAGAAPLAAVSGAGERLAAHPAPLPAAYRLSLFRSAHVEGGQI